MKEQWREYKEWLEQFIPNKFRKYLWHRQFEKAIAIFLFVAIVYIILFFLFGRELFQKAGVAINLY